MRLASGRHRPTGRLRPLLAGALLLPVASAGVWLGASALAGARAVADVSVSGGFTTGSGTVGDDLILALVVHNLGQASANSVRLEATLSPTGLPEAEPGVGTCRAEGSVSCDLGSIEAGGVVNVVVRVGLRSPGRVDADVAVSADGSDRSPLNDRLTSRAEASGPPCDRTGTMAADVLEAAPGQIVCGLGGDDVIDGDGSEGTVLGGSGQDTVSFADASDGVSASLADGLATSDHRTTRLVGVEAVDGSPYDDRLVGDDGPNRLRGLGGDDALVGMAGDDVLDGGPGRDTVDFTKARGPVEVDLSRRTATGEGTDHLASIERVLGSRFDDRLTGGIKADELRGGAGDDLLRGGGGDDALSGGGGTDTVSYSRSPNGVVVDLGAGTATGEGTDVLTHIDAIEGSDHDDLLTGSAGADELRGLDGTDVLSGGDGHDDLVGGPGDDTLVGGAGDDSVAGGKGTDACAGGTGQVRRSRCEVGPISEVMFPTAATMRPEGSLTLNDSPNRFSPSGASDGPDYVVMASRGRAAAAVSAVDLAVPSQSQVRSPVTGTVVLVRQYLLYCQSADWQLAIQPDGRPDLRVMVLHLVDLPVVPGDRVVAGVTVIGTSWTNDLPTAQENAYFADQYPHVHVEVESGDGVPIPGCEL